MPLSWNEIRSRSLSFSKEWENESSESAEAKSFWDGFFNVFGVPRRRIASFEVPVKKDEDHSGFIDLLWKGVLLVEHKSRGKDLDKAYDQALDYFPGLKDRYLPQFVLVSDFANFRLYDLETDEIHEFKLEELHKNLRLFGFIAGYVTRSFGQEDPVNIKAAEALGKLHDQLLENGYKGHALEKLLVRLLFCLFAEDTGLFEKQAFQEYIENRTSEDGSDLGMHLATFFQTLDREETTRQKNLDELLLILPYVNGKLFEESLPVAAFNSEMRESILDCCALDWGGISPAIFGSLFQSIMDKDARRNLGAHYTTETNILKALRPLFLDNLYEEFNKCKTNEKKLIQFHVKLSKILILDPACGCGNFLAVAYRELRLLELEILRNLYKKNKGGFLDIDHLVILNVDQFYGIEIEEFPAQIAQVALLLVDHQMNLKISEEFGQYFIRLPFAKSPMIFIGNALKYEWSDIVEPKLLSYIVGNPPYVGKSLQDEQQKNDVCRLFGEVKGSRVLDYVACWYIKATDYMQDNPDISAAFVSTNSITQGEQVPILWPYLFQKGIYINFAHRTFQWGSEARGKAGVHCVIIGFSLKNEKEKYIFNYETPISDPHVNKVKQINPYLVDAESIIIFRRRNPLCNVPKMVYGSKPADGGHLILTDEEKNELLKEEPNAEKYIKYYMGADEFLYGYKRWCLWLVDISPNELKKMPHVLTRVKAVKKSREGSKKEATINLAATPTIFTEIRHTGEDYLALPEVSSENRQYFPIGYENKDVIASNKIYTINNTTLYHFGVLSSKMHMVWIDCVSGRLESRIQYSSGIVYNNFPWPENKKQYENIAEKAKSIINAREKFPDSCLADLYDSIRMPPELLKAHVALDRAVDGAYRKSKFNNDSERLSYLFYLHKQITCDLVS